MCTKDLQRDPNLEKYPKRCYRGGGEPVLVFLRVPSCSYGLESWKIPKLLYQPKSSASKDGEAPSLAFC